MAEISVDLPQPLSPSTAVVSPGGRSSEIPSRTSRPPSRLLTARRLTASDTAALQSFRVQSGALMLVSGVWTDEREEGHVRRCVADQTNT